MQILNIIFTIVAIIANAAVTYFAITAWFEVRRMNRKLTGMERAMAIVTTITMGNYVKDTFEQLNEMNKERLIAYYEALRDSQNEQS